MPMTEGVAGGRPTGPARPGSLASTQSAPRRVGRPRKIAQASDGDPREEILAAAARLFEKAGFAATTTRQIAAGTGLTQGALFHYFPTKVDILLELLYRTLEPGLRFHAVLQSLTHASPTQRLCLLAYFDTLTICASPYNEAALRALPEVQRPEFDAFWDKREKLKDAFYSQLAAGIAEGVFVADNDTRGMHELVCALVESSIWWFRRGHDEPADAAKLVARNVLRLVLKESSVAEDLVEDILRDFGSVLGH